MEEGNPMGVSNQIDVISFLKLAVFGRDYVNDPIKASIHRAYQDMARTLIKPNEVNIVWKDYYDKGEEFLIEEVGEFLDNHFGITQEEFDSIHKDLCIGLINKFSTKLLTYGQAQKWINMTFKNLIVLEEKRVHNYVHVLHAPIDKIIFDRIKEEFGYKISDDVKWSKIQSHDEYMKYQLVIRKNLKDTSPIEWEFIQCIFRFENTPVPITLGHCFRCD